MEIQLNIYETEPSWSSILLLFVDRVNMQMQNHYTGDKHFFLICSFLRHGNSYGMRVENNL